MKRIFCIALAAGGFAGGAGAADATDATVARLVAVSGSVLVSNDSNIASAGEALRLKAGMRVLVTLNSAATIQYDNGCRIRLGAGERSEVRADGACAAGAMRPAIYAPVVALRK